MGDLRYALRMLLKAPAFTIPVVLALALGIGANTTIFGIVDGLLFKPLPIDRLDEVVRVMAVDPARDPRYSTRRIPSTRTIGTRRRRSRRWPRMPTATPCTSRLAAAARSG
jgi:putative ABC transport system permease protein